MVTKGESFNEIIKNDMEMIQEALKNFNITHDNQGLKQLLDKLETDINDKVKYETLLKKDTLNLEEFSSALTLLKSLALGMKVMK